MKPRLKNTVGRTAVSIFLALALAVVAVFPNASADSKLNAEKALSKVDVKMSEVDDSLDVLEETEISEFDYVEEKVVSEKLLASLPSKLDLRENNDFVTSVKDQGIYGSCWAFAAYASGEYDIAKDGGGKIDLSEKHLVYSSYKDDDNINNETFYSSNPLDNGGNIFSVINALSKFEGATLESSYPYTSLPTVNMTYKDVKTADYYLKNAIYFPAPRDSDGKYSSENVDIVKEALNEYGVLYTSYYSGSEEVLSRYYDGLPPQDPDHAVAIVGYDDNYSKSSFSSIASKQPDGNGAFLIKNSWGNYDNSDNGYFWLSYYDYTMGESVYVDMSEKKAAAGFPTPNYHDDIGFSGLSQPLSGIKKLRQAEVFTGAAFEQKLEQVSVHAYDPATDWTVKIYAGLKDAANPESGTLVASEQGIFKYAGYYTIPIDGEIILGANVDYAVVYETARQAGSQVFTFEYKGNAKDYLEYTTGQSFVSRVYSSGKTEAYTDIRKLFNNSKDVGNLDIKAYTKPVSESSKPTAKKSTDNYLSKLKTSKSKLSPAFKKSRISYKITLSKKQSWTKILATKSNKYAKVQIKLTGQKKYKNISSAKISLKKGKSKYCYIKVTSQSGKTKVYKIKISRKKR